MINPDHIGKYEIRRAIGKGAMGTVYEGFDPVIERPVAIKTILAEYLANVESGEAVARFKREAQAGGRLQHPAIVSVYEYGEDEQMAYIVMEYVAGQPLRALMRERGRFELIDVFEVMKQLLAALDYSHRNGVVHRDIKPSNVMVLSEMKIKVMDFGVARIESSSLTQVGMVMGTPTHISPEQIVGLGADSRSDLWSAGVILYELLTGCAPFLADTPATVMHNVLHVEPPAPSAIAPGVPHVFDGLVSRALAKNPDDRFQSAREFANALLAAFVKSKPGNSPGADGVPASPPRREAKKRTDSHHSPASGSSLPLPPATLAEIESSMIRSIGPLAKHLIRKCAQQARTLEEFYATLAANLPEGSERSNLLKRGEQLRLSRSDTPAGAAVPAEPAAVGKRQTFDTTTLATAEKRLALYVGPLAKVLIRRAADDSDDVNELYRKLAEHIDSADERREFLKGLA